jgi:hypothetical protein
MRFGLVIILMSIVSCSKSSSGSGSNSDLGYNDAQTNAQTYAIESIENTANSAEGASPTSFHVVGLKSAPKLKATCPVDFPETICSNGVTSINFNSCTQSDNSGNVLTLSGGITALFTLTGGSGDNTACVSVTQNQQPLPSGDSLNLVYDAHITITSLASAPQYNGMQVVQDSAPGSAWDGTTFPMAASGMAVANSSGTKTITVNGRHDAILGPDGSTWLNYATSGQLTVTGTLAASNRTVQNGSTLTTWNNVLKYKVVHTAGNDSNGHAIIWADHTCCHPTSGKLTSVFSGAVTGTSTITFLSSSCGQAFYTDVNGGVGQMTLNSCN